MGVDAPKIGRVERFGADTETKETAVARASETVSSAETEQRLADIGEMTRLVGQEFKSFFEIVPELSVEELMGEHDGMISYMREHAAQHGWPASVLRGAEALYEAPFMLANQIRLDRSRSRRAPRFQDMPQESRDAVFELSEWQQKVGDFFIANNAAGVTPQQSRKLFDLFFDAWIKIANASSSFVEKMIPDAGKEEISAAKDFESLKQGIWGTVGVALLLRERGYDLYWSSPRADVLRKIDLFAVSPSGQEELAISCKCWSNIDENVLIGSEAGLQKVPYHRREELANEWNKLEHGVRNYIKERRLDINHPRRNIKVVPFLTAISTQRQDSVSGRIRQPRAAAHA